MTIPTNMNGRLILSMVLFCSFLIVSNAYARSQKAEDSNGHKFFVLDGHVVHDAGSLHNHVSNFGLIGSAYSSSFSYSHAPSGRWPGANGADYLYSGGLWLGGIINGEKRVSFGGYESVLFPGSAPEDSIYHTQHDAPGGVRFPWPGADDDGDGLEDEDPLNGRDDDGDGLVDEDFAAISHQHHWCEMRDDTELASYAYPSHKALNLAIAQDTYQWDLPLITNAIGYDFTITNVGEEPVQDVYFGMHGDFDLDNYLVDLAGYYEGMVEASNGNSYPVSLAYMHDGASSNPLEGYQGWLLLGHTTDPDGISAPVLPQVNAFCVYTYYTRPNNDSAQYDALSMNAFDLPTSIPDDYQILTSSGPFPTLLPGESLKYQMALVAGGSLEELKINAAEMVACFQGRLFGRDGKLERVHWIPLDEGVAAVEPENSLPGKQSPLLSAYPNPFNPRLGVKFVTTQSGPVRLQAFDMRGRLVRTLVNESRPAGEGTLAWDGLNNQGQAVASGVYELRLETGGELAAHRVTLVR